MRHQARTGLRQGQPARLSFRPLSSAAPDFFPFACFSVLSAFYSPTFLFGNFFRFDFCKSTICAPGFFGCELCLKRSRETPPEPIYKLFAVRLKMRTIQRSRIRKTAFLQFPQEGSCQMVSALRYFFFQASAGCGAGSFSVSAICAASASAWRGHCT